MNKYTPGPWFTKKARTLINVKGACGEQITQVSIYRENDAILISCAPDLVIELRQAIIQMEMAAECIEKGRYDEALLHVSSLMQSKKEVLAKATGESE